MRIKAEQRHLDLIVHPVRSRILMALMGKEATAGQVADILQDVPLASLYRHLDLLLNGQILEVAEERHARGKPEKLYRVAGAGARLRPQDFQSKEDHIRAFQQVISGISSAYAGYVDNPRFVPGQAKAAMFVMPVDITGDNRDAFVAEIRAAAEKYRPEGGRSERAVFGAFVIPETP